MKEKIHIPTIVFEASWIYDYMWKAVWDRLWQSLYPEEKYPAREEILTCAQKMDAYWNQKKDGILEELSTVSHLRWQRSEIPCFVVGARKLGVPPKKRSSDPAAFSGFAHPLTIRIHDYLKGPDLFLRLLIHELIHNLMNDNMDLYGNRWVEKYLEQKYSAERPFTQNHILVYALHAHVHRKFFSTEIDEVGRSSLDDYKRAWAVVQEDGYEDIIHDFVKHVEEKKRSNL